jgi:hypothetical protein
MNIEKRKEEIMSAWDNFYYGIGENFADLIVTQEQSMIAQLEADKAELLKMLRIAKDNSCGCMDHYLTDMEDLIQKMETK